MPNTQQFNFTVVICAFVALIVGVSTYSLMSKPSKGDRLVAASEPSRPAVPPSAVTPAAPEPVITIPAPVAAGPAPAETAPIQAVTIAKPIPRPSKHKRKARRIAKAVKAEPCVGPLCVLVR